MSAPVYLWSDLLVWFLLALAASCAVLFIAGLAKASSREMPPPPAKEPAPAMPPTLAAHIARQLVADLDADWEALQREIGGQP